MEAKQVRIILAFYSAKEDEPEKALAEVRTLGHKVSLFRQDGTSRATTKAAERYASLRLDGESLIVAEVPASAVQAIVKELLRTSSPAVFVLREDLASLPAETA